MNLTWGESQHVAKDVEQWRELDVLCWVSYDHQFLFTNCISLMWRVYWFIIPSILFYSFNNIFVYLDVHMYIGHIKRNKCKWISWKRRNKETDSERRDGEGERQNLCNLSANTDVERLPDQCAEHHCRAECFSLQPPAVWLHSQNLCCCKLKRDFSKCSLSLFPRLLAPLCRSLHLSLHLSLFHLSITPRRQGMVNKNHAGIIKQSEDMMHCLCSANSTREDYEESKCIDVLCTYFLYSLYSRSMASWLATVLNVPSLSSSNPLHTLTHCSSVSSNIHLSSS